MEREPVNLTAIFDLAERIADDRITGDEVARDVAALTEWLLRGDPMAALRVLSEFMAHADAAATEPSQQVFLREVAARLGLLQGQRKTSHVALVAAVEELRALRQPAGVARHLARGAALLDDLRGQMGPENERMQWQEVMAAPLHGVAARYALHRATTAGTPEERARFEDDAWHACHRTKGRALREAMGAEAATVPPPSEVIEDLTRLCVREGNERPLLVEYFLLNEEEVALFLVLLGREPRREVRVLDVAKGAVFDWALRWRTAIRVIEEAKMSRSIETEADQEPLHAVLAEMQVLFGPWKELLERWAPTEIVLAPHFGLHVLPLAAVALDGVPLGVRLPVSHLPVPPMARELLQRMRGAAPPRHAVLFGHGTPRAAAEVEIVAGVLRDGGWSSAEFVREAATREAVVAHAAGAGLVHFAAHTEMIPGDLGASGVRLADGTLSVDEVLGRVRLAPGALVILGSCDSGRPAPMSSDEMLALHRAYLIAGATAIVATLWRADDRVGAMFAGAFHRAWLVDGVDLAEAHRRAVSRLYEKHRAVPYLWAAHVLAGRGPRRCNWKEAA